MKYPLIVCTFLIAVGIDHDLDFGIRVHSNIEDFSVPSKPCIRPSTVITDSDGCNAVNDK